MPTSGHVLLSAGHNSAHDRFQQICDALGLTGSSPVVFMSELEFYGDAGGNRDDTNIAVGGYLSTVDRWKQFKEPWHSALSDEGIECFHRTDMESFWEGNLAEKKWDRDHLIQVLNRLHNIIKKHTIRGSGHAVKNRAFAELMPSRVAQQYGGPYGWCVLLEVVEVGLWARRHGHWVTYFFEAGDEGRHEADATIARLYRNQRYRELFRIGGWGFYPKRDDPKTGQKGLIQLQPADFIAYEAFKDIDNYIAGSPRPARLSRKELIRPEVDQLNFWDDKAFAKWLVRWAEFKGDVVETLFTLDPYS